MKNLFLTTIAPVAVLVSAPHAQLTLDIYEDYMSTPGQTNLVVHGFGTFNASSAGLASSTFGNSIYDFRPTAGAILLGTSATQPVNTYLNALSTSINFGSMDLNMATLSVTTDNTQTFGLQGENLISPFGYAGETLNNRFVGIKRPSLTIGKSTTNSHTSKVRNKEPLFAIGGGSFNC